MTFINRWAEIISFRKFNWVDFELLDVGIEIDKIAGEIEIRFIVLGLGCCFSFIYSKQQHERFMKNLEERAGMALEEVLEQINSGRIKVPQDNKPDESDANLTGRR